MLAFNPYILLAGPSCNCSWNVLLSWPGNRPNLKHSHQNSVPPLQQRGRLILSLTDITALTLDKITTHPFWWANAGSFNQASTTLVCANGQKSTSGAIVQATTQTLYAPHIANSSLPCPNPPERPLIQRPQQSLESLNNKFLLLHPFNPVNINRLRNLLTTSQREGFTEGFHINRAHVHILSDQFSSYPPSSDLLHYNHNSALHHADIVTNKLNLKKAAWLGHLMSHHYEVSKFTHLSLQRKKSKGKYCLSFPDGDFVNDQIENYKGSVKYQTLDEAIDTILTLCPGCTLSKTDIHHRFKIILVHPLDWSKLGIFWNSKYWFDLTLPQVYRSSYKIFETFSHDLEWIAKNKLGIH